MATEINQALRRLKGGTPDIIGGAVITIDGLVIASELPGKIDEDLIGGMTASMLGVGERISAELMRSEMQQVYVRSPEGYVLVNEVGNNAALITLVSRNARLGLILLEVKRCVAELETMLSAD